MGIRQIFDKLEEWILITFLTVTVLLVIGQVISRYVIDFPMGWSVEISRYFFIWIAWISVSFAIKHNSHIRIELIKSSVKKKYSKLFDIISILMFFVFALIIMVTGTEFIMSIQSTSQVSPSAGIPMWIVYLAIPVAGVLICIRLIQQIIFTLKNKNT